MPNISDASPVQTLLVPVDGSGYSLAALDAAAELAHTMGAKISVCHVVDNAMVARLSFGDPASYAGCYETLRADGQRYLEEARERLMREKLDCHAELRSGEPCHEIKEIAAQEGAGMIIMGTHGRTGLPHALMGSVAEGVVRIATVPVLVIPRAYGKRHTSRRSD